MSTCNITAGFQLGCRDNTGGVKRVYILSGSVAKVVDNGLFLITAITGSAGSKFFAFDQVNQTANYTETINSSIENGTIFYQQDLVLQFHKYQDSLQNMINTLGAQPNAKIILETQNGSADNNAKFFFLGQYNGMTLSAGTGQTGTAYGDLNGYSLTFTAFEPEPAKEISASYDATKTVFEMLSGSLNNITVGY
jgi:hypothetical protein